MDLSIEKIGDATIIRIQTARVVYPLLPTLVAVVTIFHDELYRKRFLPTVTDEDLDRMARDVRRERPSGAPSVAPCVTPSGAP